VGRPRPQNETWVAVRCLRDEVPLVTLNAVGFTDLTERHGLVLPAGRK
jgi:hypothetical protein